MVDLGLSVKWAKYNLGATGGSSAADWYGGYYAWGELASGKTDYIYTWNNYQYGNPPSKYNTTDHLTTLEASDDAATVAYGHNFRMPTKTELNELKGLTNEWVEDYQGINGLNGRLFHGTGAYSANTLFIPAAGICYGGGRYFVGDYGYMWSASLVGDYVDVAWCLDFSDEGLYVENFFRYYGYSVRTVSSI